LEEKPFTQAALAASMGMQGSWTAGLACVSSVGGSGADGSSLASWRARAMPRVAQRISTIVLGLHIGYPVITDVMWYT
jgi:hypothetical protein